MAYFLDLFSPETYEAFKRTPRDTSGFRLRQKNAAERVRAGDKLLCYLTRLSRWCGLLEVTSGPFMDDSPIFYPEADPFVVRFKVRPTIVLDIEKAVPIHEDAVWQSLSFTKNHDKNSLTWTGKIRASLVQFDESDGLFLEELLTRQRDNGATYTFDREGYEKLITHTVRRVEKSIPVSVPDDVEREPEKLLTEVEARESIRVQALIADIGSQMGLRIWIPRSDRACCCQRSAKSPRGCA